MSETYDYMTSLSEDDLCDLCWLATICVDDIDPAGWVGPDPTCQDQVKHGCDDKSTCLCYCVDNKEVA